MKLADLFSAFPHIRLGNSASERVSSLCFDSRKLEKNCVYVAVRGSRHDGHAFLEEAVRAGAIGLVVEDISKVPEGFFGAVVKTDDARAALNQLAARWFGETSKRLFCVGVTGTNGKTTTTYMIEAILTELGWPTGVIGTIDHHLGNQVWHTEMTTPDPLSFQKRLREFEDLGARAVTLEASSHALRQCRVDEVSFDVAVFTNLSRDHLDYHSDMEDYFQAKLKLFSKLLARSKKAHRRAVINRDDEYGRRIGVKDGALLWTYGASQANTEAGADTNADISFQILHRDFGGTTFDLQTPQGACRLRLPMAGLHNVYNACAAIGVGLAAGATLETCRMALEKFGGVRGRLEAVPNTKGIHVFVDFAHTDAALEGILANLNRVRMEAGLKNRLITVFGCGGDRDKGKRPLMMKAALAGSDLVFLTSDNPRTEDPEAILQDALRETSAADIALRVRKDIDRRKAIGMALNEAKPGDVVLIAGKGHETYQQIGTQKFPFSDFDVVRDWLA